MHTVELLAAGSSSGSIPAASTTGIGRQSTRFHGAAGIMGYAGRLAALGCRRPIADRDFCFFPSAQAVPMIPEKKTNIRRTPKTDPVWINGVPPKPMFIDYKDLDLLSKLINRHGKIVSRRKTGCHAASQHAVSKAIKRARFMGLLPYVGG
jgi:small subunit ribosomal protein S18